MAQGTTQLEQLVNSLEGDTRIQVELLLELTKVYNGEKKAEEFVEQRKADLEKIVMSRPSLKEHYKKLDNEDEKKQYLQRLVLHPTFRQAVINSAGELASDGLIKTTEIQQNREKIRDAETKIELITATRNYLEKLRNSLTSGQQLDTAKDAILDEIVKEFNKRHTSNQIKFNQKTKKKFSSALTQIRKLHNNGEINNQDFTYYSELIKYISNIESITDTNDLNNYYDELNRKEQQHRDTINEATTSIDTAQQQIANKFRVSLVSAAVDLEIDEIERGIQEKHKQKKEEKQQQELQQKQDEEEKKLYQNQEFIDNIIADAKQDIENAIKFNDDKNLSKRNAFRGIYNNITGLWARAVAGHNIEEIIKDTTTKDHIEKLKQLNSKGYLQVQSEVLAYILQLKLLADREVTKMGSLSRITPDIATRAEIMAVIRRIAMNGNPDLIKRVTEYFQNIEELYKSLGYDPEKAKKSKVITKASVLGGALLLAGIGIGLGVRHIFFNWWQ